MEQTFDPSKLPAWRYAASSVIGTSHERSGLPCQDACACAVLHVLDKDVLLGVAADGAGSAARADEGAALVCRTVCRVAPAVIADAGGVSAMTRAYAERLVSEVRDSVLLHADASGVFPRDLASTLLLAIVADDASFYLQIGDGAIVVSRHDDQDGFGWIFWPQHGEYINETCFVTDERAISSMQTEVARGLIDEVALFTDGIQPLVLNYANQTVHDAFFERMLKPLRSLEQPGRSMDLETHLRQYLAAKAINDRTDDDRTLVLASRRSPRD